MDKEPQSNIDVDIKKISRLLKMLKTKLAWKSEIPDQILSGASPEKNYKVRKNWWAGLAQDLYSIKNLFSDLGITTFQTDIANFFIEFGSDDFESRLTTKEDIEKADLLISRLIIELENLQNNINRV